MENQGNKFYLSLNKYLGFNMYIYIYIARQYNVGIQTLGTFRDFTCNFVMSLSASIVIIFADKGVKKEVSGKKEIKSFRD